MYSIIYKLHELLYTRLWNINIKKRKMIPRTNVTSPLYLRYIHLYITIRRYNYNCANVLPYLLLLNINTREYWIERKGTVTNCYQVDRYSFSTKKINDGMSQGMEKAKVIFYHQAREREREKEKRQMIIKMMKQCTENNKNVINIRICIISNKYTHIIGCITDVTQIFHSCFRWNKSKRLPTWKSVYCTKTFSKGQAVVKLSEALQI